MVREKVAIMGPVPKKGCEELHNQLGATFDLYYVKTLADYEILQDAQYIILRTLKLTAADIGTIPNLKLIHRWGCGYDSVDVAAAGMRNIPVAITAGSNSIQVSEYTVMLMMNVYRNFLRINKKVMEGEWRDESIFGTSYVIEGKQVGLVGMGSIGQRVARKVQGLGASVAYYDIKRLPADEERSCGYTFMELKELAGTSDIISLHLPLMPATRGIINKEIFNIMRPTSIIINTARGGLINEDDLYSALVEGKILGAGLDVFEEEPVNPGNPLLGLPSVVASSHSAANTAENAVIMARHCAGNIFRVARGESLPASDIVNAHLFQSAPAIG